MEVPNEVWTEILKYCDISTLFNLMLTCKRLNSCCQTEIVWHCQWKKVISRYQQTKDSENGVSSELHYKDMCQRFVKIFGLKDNRKTETHAPSVLHGMDYVCCKCKGVLCTRQCMETNDELIIFDFGSKTTWFKYESENTGQLSMHPTVAPITEVTSADISPNHASGEELLLADSCPVCSKIIKKRLSGLSHNVGPYKDKKRFASAFTRLSLKGLHCFESSQLDSDETEYTAAVLNNPLVPQDCCEASAATGLVTLVPGESSALGDVPIASGNNLSGTNTTSVLEQGNSDENNTTAPADNNTSASSMSASTSSTNSINTTQQKAQVQTLLFLMTHMLKRNAFLPGKNIPFVICEPLKFDCNTKRDIIRHVFEDLKVPGVCFVTKPVAVSLYIGLDTCLVVDSGANNTVVTPVINQTSVESATQWKPIGGRHISLHLKECLRMKGLDFEVDEANLDSSQVKRECWLSYNPETESRRKIPNKNITVKGQRVGESEHFQVALGHELYLAVENMYLNLRLAEMIKASVSQFDPMTQTKLLSNIVLSGGSCRLSGLSNRLTRDLQEVLSEHSNCIRVCDPRLMTGRTDVVVGASYIKKLDSVNWIDRQEYVYNGIDGIEEISC